MVKVSFKTVQGKQFQLELEDDTKVRAADGLDGPARACQARGWEFGGWQSTPQLIMALSLSTAWTWREEPRRDRCRLRPADEGARTLPHSAGC